MDVTLLTIAALAGAIYVLTPGPAVLALLGIGASQGRRAGAAFLGGHLLGDLLWCLLAIIAIVGARQIDPRFFDLLGLLCGLYLFYLGLRALLSRPDASGRVEAAPGSPLRRGVALGLTNPKGYPVALAMFTALLAERGAALTWDKAPLLLVAAFIGFLLADLVLVWLVGLAPLRRFYRRYDRWIVRITGALFIGFSVQAFHAALPGLLLRRS